MPSKKKRLGINLTKEAQNIYSKNYKTLSKEIKDLNGRITHVHGLEDNIFKMTIFPKLIYRFNAIPIEIPF